MRMLLLPILILVIVTLPIAATDAQCVGLRADFQKRMELWSLSLKAASGGDAQRKIWAERPDAMAVAAKMWSTMQGQLAQEWTLDHAAWLLKLVCSQKIEQNQEEAQQLRTAIIQQTTAAVSSHHVRSTRIAPMCMSLLAVGDKSAMKLLERIDKENPSRKMQGVAALAVAYMLGNLGDDTKILQRRLTLIRKAIIESHDVKVENATVADLASDQLYVIRYLGKGREAPELTGVDVASKAIKLSDYRGKVVVLLFWNASMPECDVFLEVHRSMKEKLAGKNIEIIGVFSDADSSLRTLHAEKLTTWSNFTDADKKLAKAYRVNNFPTAFVLDGERKIHYSGAPGSFAELTAEALLVK